MPKDLRAARRRHEEAAPLHEEIPYWGWLGDGRTCLTVGGELVTLAAMETYESSGRPGEYLDYVLERWVRLLSTAGARTRVYLYLLRRPASDFPSGVASQGPARGAGAAGPGRTAAVPGAPAADARRGGGVVAGRAAEAAPRARLRRWSAPGGSSAPRAGSRPGRWRRSSGKPARWRMPWTPRRAWSRT